MAMARTRNQPDGGHLDRSGFERDQPRGGQVAAGLQLRREVVLHAHAVRPLDGRELQAALAHQAP